MVSLIDLFVVLSLIWGIYIGYQRGLILEFFAIGIFMLGIILANMFALAATKVFPRYNMTSPYILLVMFALALFAIAYLTKIAVDLLKKVLGENVQVTTPMRYIGMALSGGKVFLADSIILYLLNALNDAKHFLPDDMVARSLFNEALVKLAPFVFRFLQNYNFQDNIM